MSRELSGPFAIWFPEDLLETTAATSDAHAENFTRYVLKGVSLLALIEARDMWPCYLRVRAGDTENRFPTPYQDEPPARLKKVAFSLEPHHHIALNSLAAQTGLGKSRLLREGARVRNSLHGIFGYQPYFQLDDQEADLHYVCIVS